jgi:hypothetical protein
MRALQALKQLQAESTPAPPVELDPPVLNPPSLSPSPQTTSPQIGFVLPLPSQIAPTGARSFPPPPPCPSPHFPVTIPVAASIA